MAGGAVISTSVDTSRVEAPVTFKTYLMCVFAAFGGIFFGYDSGYISGVIGMKKFIMQYEGLVSTSSPEASSQHLANPGFVGSAYHPGKEVCHSCLEKVPHRLHSVCRNILWCFGRW